LERVAGIEPASSAWKAEVLAVELHPQRRQDYPGLRREPHSECFPMVVEHEKLS
jgi:hypothetical protein